MADGMKTFNAKQKSKDQPPVSTITVGEMKAALNNYPGDLPLLTEWKGVAGDSFIEGVTKKCRVKSAAPADYLQKQSCLVFMLTE